jgi:tRNA dimethylallyltransferase
MSSNDRPLVIAIVGPTASGKSALAVSLAIELETVVLSADSRQIYQGLDIGTNKISVAARQGIDHYLLDILPANDTSGYDAARYADAALKILNELFFKYRIIIVCGGTGLYIKALIEGLDAIPPVDSVIRSRLRQQYQLEGLAPLLSMLQKADPVCYQRIDKHNPVRVLRALEVCYSTGLPFSDFQQHRPAKRTFDTYIIGINPPRAQLHQAINQRAEQMLTDGLLAETEYFLAQGCTVQHPAFQAIGYREAVACLNRQITTEQLLAQLQAQTRQYARRQITWFKKVANISWIEKPEIKMTLKSIQSYQFSRYR